MSLRLTEAEYAALLGRRKKPVSAVQNRGTRHEDAFAAQLQDAVIPFEREYRFAPPRKFRFDFVLLPLVLHLAVEIDGGVHRIDARFRSDREKGNLALQHGWRVVHLGVDQIRTGEAISEVLRALQLPAVRTCNQALLTA